MNKDSTIVATDCWLIADGGAYLSVAALNLYLFGLMKIGSLANRMRDEL